MRPCLIVALAVLLVGLIAGCPKPPATEQAVSADAGRPAPDASPQEPAAAEEPAAEDAAAGVSRAVSPEAKEEGAETENKGETVTTDSGLKYVDLKVGDGAAPTAGARVAVHYTGTLEDGTKFDSSLDRGEPITFTIGAGEVIEGWDEGVMSMKVGGKRKLTIPSDLAYGAEGRPPVIPPDATLIFEVELLKVE